MAAINDLISQIQDETLRNRIQEEVSKMAKQKKFGLVFEEHDGIEMNWGVTGETLARLLEKKVIQVLRSCSDVWFVHRFSVMFSWMTP